MGSGNYILGGSLQRDATHYAKEVNSTYTISPSQRDAHVFAGMLAEPHRASFLELHRLLLGGLLPRWYHFRPDQGSFGLELCEGDHSWRVDAGKKPQGLRFLGERASVDHVRSVFPIATDGSFRLFVLVRDGRVAEMSQEVPGVLANWFLDLDSYLSTMVRLSATPKHFSVQDTVNVLRSVEGAEDYVAELEEM